MDRLIGIRGKFILDIAQTLNEQTIVVNIDETSFGRDIGIEYGWGPVGVKTEYQASCFRESIKMISAITSLGDTFNHLATRNTNSAAFLEFLKDFKKVITN